jgi:hypothetical protein
MGPANRKTKGDDNSPLESDFGVGMELIRAHIAEEAGRELMSVVLITSGLLEQTLQEAKTDPNLQDTFEKPMLALLDMGVPIVTAAGNVDKDIPTSFINALPQLLQHKEDLPIINVGNADYEGKRKASSLYFSADIDEQLIYAPGTEVPTLNKDGFQAVPATGTSFCKGVFKLIVVVPTDSSSCSPGCRSHCDVFRPRADATPLEWLDRPGAGNSNQKVPLFR